MRADQKPDPLPFHIWKGKKIKPILHKSNLNCQTLTTPNPSPYMATTNNLELHYNKEQEEAYWTTSQLPSSFLPEAMETRKGSSITWLLSSFFLLVFLLHSSNSNAEVHHHDFVVRLPFSNFFHLYLLYFQINGSLYLELCCFI